jgi:hypothetical protein
MQVKRLLQIVVIGSLMTLSLFAQGSPGGKKQPAPGWARGTWYWTGGPDRMMVINNDGTLSLNTAGATSYGVYYKGRIYLNGNASTITQAGNNIRTYNETTGETSDYAHSVWTGNDNKTDPAPQWMIGTWYWTGGPDRTLVVESGGHITLVSGGQTSYGRYYKNKIHLNNNASTVTHAGNLMRTYNESSGETSDYSRNQYSNGNSSLNMEAPPSWAVGSWVAGDVLKISMTISLNGKVEFEEHGVKSHGRYWQGYIYMMSDGNRLKLTRDGKKIRTRSESSGKTLEWSHVLLLPRI